MNVSTNYKISQCDGTVCDVLIILIVLPCADFRVSKKSSRGGSGAPTGKRIAFALAMALKNMSKLP